MDELETMLAQLHLEYASEPKRRFPYEDIKRLYSAYRDEFTKADPEGLITADLNEYFAFIAGLASGGIRSRLDDPQRRSRAKQLLEKTFDQRYPQYEFLSRIDLSSYPDLAAEFDFSTRLRYRLLGILDVIERRISNDSIAVATEPPQA